jgi:hypothetical protein
MQKVLYGKLTSKEQKMARSGRVYQELKLESGEKLLCFRDIAQVAEGLKEGEEITAVVKLGKQGFLVDKLFQGRVEVIKVPATGRKARGKAQRPEWTLRASVARTAAMLLSSEYYSAKSLRRLTEALEHYLCEGEFPEGFGNKA